MIKIDKKEIYRYLGYRRRTPDAEVIRMVDSCVEDLQREVTPRFIYRKYPVESVYTIPAPGLLPDENLSGDRKPGTAASRRD